MVVCSGTSNRVYWCFNISWLKSMQQGRGSMGIHKHRISGYPTRSPRYKFMQQLEANRNQINKPRVKLLYTTVADALKGEKPK